MNQPLSPERNLLTPTVDLEGIVARLPFRSDVALILGSGLGAIANTLLGQQHAVATSELPGYPVSTVPGHLGHILYGMFEQLRVLAFQGRVHLYEGYSPDIVATPVRLAHKLGARTLIVTNASGSFSRRFAPGDLLLIEDHINFQFRNPLRGPNGDGESRWPDLGHAYDEPLKLLAERVAMREGILLKRGVLAGVLGPNYETAAESRMLARLGADAGCMSTIPEVITAVALGMKVLGLSCVTNYAAGIADAPLDHEDVQRVAARAANQFGRVLRGVLKEMNKEQRR